MRDATARLYDVDEDSVMINIQLGIISFSAKKGRFVDLDKLHESIWATRLSGKTGMILHWMDVTTEGEVVIEGKRTLLKLVGSEARFVLMEDTKAKGGAETLAQLREQVGKGKVRVTGRLDGWAGHFPPFLSEKPARPRRILVKKFKMKSEKK